MIKNPDAAGAFTALDAINKSESFGNFDLTQIDNPIRNQLFVVRNALKNLIIFFKRKN